MSRVLDLDDIMTFTLDPAIGAHDESADLAGRNGQPCRVMYRGVGPSWWVMFSDGRYAPVHTNELSYSGATR